MLKDDSVAGSKLALLLIGGGIGATLALLFAPKPGAELRQDVSDAARQGAVKTRDTAQQLQKQAANYYDTARTKVSDVYQTVLETAQSLPAKAQQTLAHKTEPLQAGLEAGKEVYADRKNSVQPSV
jgi:gas vesicle protein